MLSTLIPSIGFFFSSTALASDFHVQIMMGPGSGKICLEDECGSRHTGSALVLEIGSNIENRFTLGFAMNAGIHFNDDLHGQYWAEEGSSNLSAHLLKAGVYLTPSILVQAGAGMGRDFYSISTGNPLDKRVGLAVGADISLQRWVKENWAVGVRAQGLMMKYGETQLSNDVEMNYSPGSANHLGGGLYLHYMVDGGKKAEDEG